MSLSWSVFNFDCFKVVSIDTIPHRRRTQSTQHPMIDAWCSIQYHTDTVPHDRVIDACSTAYRHSRLIDTVPHRYTPWSTHAAAAVPHRHSTPWSTHAVPHRHCTHIDFSEKSTQYPIDTVPYRHSTSSTQYPRRTVPRYVQLDQYPNPTSMTPSSSTQR